MTSDMSEDASGQVSSETAIVEGKKPSSRNKTNPTMRVVVQSSRKVFFDEQATSISAVNATGAFDILPHHHNFITLIDPCELSIRRPDDPDDQRIKISGGLMHVKADLVTVFLDV